MLLCHCVSWPLTLQKYCTVYLWTDITASQKLWIFVDDCVHRNPSIGTSSHPSSFKVQLILPFDLCWGFPCGLFPSAFLTKIFVVYFLYSMRDRHMFCPLHSLDFCHPNNMWWIAQIMKLIVQVAPEPCPNVLLNVLKHCRGVFFA